MQTGIAVRDTDRKQGNVMNNNPNHGSSHKEKQMNARTRTTPVAVLVTLGLALTAWAAEPDAKRFRLDAPPEVRKIPELVRSKTDKRVWEKTGVELEFRVPKARLSPPPVWVEGVKACEIELRPNPSRSSFLPAGAIIGLACFLRPAPAAVSGGA